MALLLTVVFLFFVIVGFTRDWDEDGCGILVVGFLIGLVITSIFGGLVINGRTIQAKIEMYQEENTNIEESMDLLVQKYMNYESDTYGDLKGESSITLVSLYPELKADTLVEQQLVIYVENNNKIKSLKEKQINISNYRWWLYFGK
jgi:hypothetical protein